MAPPDNSFGKLRSPFAQSRLVWLAVAVLGLLAVVSLYRGTQNALGLTETARSLDLASYWLGGRILLQGGDPYQAALAGSLWDHLPAGIEALGPGFDAVPANAPLQMILFAPLMGMSWQFARAAFAGLNLLSILLLPLLLGRMLKNRSPLRERLLLPVLFWAMLPTRNALSNGQTSILVLFGALLALHWARERPLLSGAVLALSLSKYSLTLPLLGGFVAFGFWLPMIVALLVHLATFPLLALILGEPLLTPFQSYVQMLRSHAGFGGETTILSLFGRLGLPVEAGWLVTASVLVATCGLLLGVWFKRRGAVVQSGGLQQRLAVPLAALLLSCGLLIVYHRTYDAVVLIAAMPAIWSLRNVTRRMPDGAGLQAGLAWALVPVFVIYLLPRASFASLWAQWESVLIIASALAALLAWLVTVGVMLLHLRAEPSGQLTTADRMGT